MKNNAFKLPSNRSFGIVFFVVFLIIAVWPLKSNGDIRIIPICISLVFLILGLFNSNFLKPLNFLWMKFGILLGNIISPIVMGIIFFLVVTPIAIIMKILGKDILGIKKNNKKTYWINKTGPKSKMKNQF